MVRRALVLAMVTGLSVGCGEPAAESKDASADTEDDTGGGGSGDTWRPSGSGVAYFLDGAEDNSLFHLEMTRCTEPADGQAYYGWVSRGGADAIAVGEIACVGEEVYFEHDIGENAIIGGYDTFEAWATDNGGATPAGTQLWVGQVDPVVYTVIQDLLIASDVTPDGQGSLRSVETAVQNVRDVAQAALDATFDQAAFRESGETIANALDGAGEDRDDDGSVATLDGQLPVLGADGYIELILADLTTASLQVDPGNPVKDYINYAYDCTQKIETHATYAAINADVVAVCLSEDSCDVRMEDALEEIDYALVGEDENEDGTVDLLTEGTVECAVKWVYELVQMPVATP